MNLITKTKGLMAMVRIVRDPSRLDEVFSLTDSLADDAALQSIVSRCAATPEGLAALATLPRLGRLDCSMLQTFPPGTLARAFAEHMLAHNLDPSAIPTLPAHDERDWVKAHLYETHDLWHLVTGFETDVAGELGLQAFYAAQLGIGLPLAIIAAGLLNATLFAPADGDSRMQAIVTGWTMGQAAQSLVGVPWDDMWHQPLSEIRAQLRIHF